MTELRFHRDLYAEDAVRDAVQKFAGFAEIGCVDHADHLTVQIESPRPEREQRIARELSNFALGLTIRSRVAR